MTVTLVGERPLGSALQRAIGREWVARALVGGLLALGLGLRLWGLDWGLPWAFHPDEVNYVDRAQELITSGSLNPRYFENPSLLTYLIALELVVVRVLGPLAGPLRFDLPATAYLLARLDSALLGVFPVLAALVLRYVGPRRSWARARPVQGGPTWTHRAGVALLLTWPFAWVGLILLGKTVL